MNAACAYTISGANSGSYTVNHMDTICLEAGANFTGTVILKGGVLVNNATTSQTFTMDFFSGFTTSAVYNYGTIALSSFSIDNSTDFYNYGTLSLSSSLSLKSFSELNNYGTLTASKLTVDGSLYTNYGTSTFSGTLQINSNGAWETYHGSTTNCNTLNIKKDSHLYGGQITVAGATTINSGLTVEFHGACLNTNSFVGKGYLHGVNCGTVTVTTSSTVQGSGGITGDIAFVDHHWVFCTMGELRLPRAAHARSV